MVDQCPFFLEALTKVDNNKFFFQQHLKVAFDLLLPLAHACLLPFEQFIMYEMVQFQHSILEHLHHHTLFSMFFDKISEAQCAQILSCSGLGASAWFITWLVFLAFWLLYPICSTTLCIRLGLPHPSIVRIPWCVWHIPLTLWLFTSYVTFMATNALEPMMQFVTPLSQLHEMLTSTWDENNYMHSLQPWSTPFIDESTLCSPKMTFAP